MNHELITESNLRQNFKNMIYLLTKILTKEKAEGYIILNYLIITRQHKYYVRFMIEKKKQMYNITCMSNKNQQGSIHESP